MPDKTYRVEFEYKMFKCEHEGADHSKDVLMHAAEGVYEDMEYEDLVKLEGAIMGALASMGMEELEKKKKKNK